MQRGQIYEYSGRLTMDFYIHGLTIQSWSWDFTIKTAIPTSSH